MSNDNKKLKGKINELVGVATGDREQEARGVVQQSTGREPSPKEKDKAKRIVKAKHHDYGDRVPPQAVPHHER
jgi:uncharacterized protein YjbJ (UPF0337 family)